MLELLLRPGVPASSTAWAFPIAWSTRPPATWAGRPIASSTSKPGCPAAATAGEYGEVTSTSNCTDYQARRLGIRYRTKGEKGTHFVHTLNGTAIAISRALIAILENYQQADGSIVVPEVLASLGGQGPDRPASLNGAVIAAWASRHKRSAASAVGASAIARTIGSVLLARTSSHLPGQSSRRPSSRSALASAKCRSTASSAAAILLARQRDLRLHDFVARQLVGQLADCHLAVRPWRRASAPCRRSCRAPDRRADRSRRRCLRRRARRRARASHRRRSPRPPPSGRTARRTSRPGPAAMRLVEQLVTIGPALAAQHVIDAQSPACIPRRGSGPLRRSRPAGRRRDPGRSRCRAAARGTAASTPARFSAVGSGVCSNWPSGVAAEQRRLAAEFFEQPPAEQAAGAVVGVEQAP